MWRLSKCLRHEEDIRIQNPVKSGYALRLPKPLPRYVKEEDLKRFFKVIKKRRDQAMFMLMFRCGLRVEEVTALTISAVDLPRRRVTVQNGKGMKARIVYISSDAGEALVRYLKGRPAVRVDKLFLVEKGTCKGRPISVRGVQKRMEYYARKSGINVSCHQLRHTMATQLRNAEADLVTIQDLLGHSSTPPSAIARCQIQKCNEIILKRWTGSLNGTGHMLTMARSPASGLLYTRSKMGLDKPKKEIYNLS